MKTTPEQLRDIAVSLIDEALYYETNVDISLKKIENDVVVTVTFFIKHGYNFSLNMYTFYPYHKNETIKDECLQYIITNHFVNNIKKK